MSAELTRAEVFGVWARSLWLQASWNTRGMQNVGMLYALYPALEKLFPDPTSRQQAAQRHLAFFNTQPYMAAAILGGVLHLEQKVARGELAPQKVEAFKKALLGPLAALGDGFFWLSLRPFVGALGAFLVPWLGPWALLVMWLVYNVVHLAIRAQGFRVGFEKGEGVLAMLSALQLPRRGAALRIACAWMVGAGGGVCLADVSAALSLPWLLGSGAVALGTYWALGKKANAYVLFYAVMALVVTVLAIEL